ncbi:dNTP triphosphohydrolase [Ruminococcus bromii]|nr:dNTP triphosphohydrolase [Ruminococcus bromii]
MGYEYTKKHRIYKSNKNENTLHKLAQKNEYCKRQYDLKEPTSDGRSEYQRDYDRIIYSKSFRRIVDKTQVFSASKGDHYRTRMTHTMIVCQIARSICNALNCNQALTEAIAISHDLGHTPFGHIGERTLNNILKKSFPEVGGFKHNYQGLRVVSMLEKDYYEIDGLDLSYQVMEGMFKHTSQKKDIDVSEFVNDDELIEYLHVNIPYCLNIRVRKKILMFLNL